MTIGKQWELIRPRHPHISTTLLRPSPCSLWSNWSHRDAAALHAANQYIFRPWANCQQLLIIRGSDMFFRETQNDGSFLETKLWGSWNIIWRPWNVLVIWGTSQIPRGVMRKSQSPFPYPFGEVVKLRNALLRSTSAWHIWISRWWLLYTCNKRMWLKRRLPV